MAALAAFASTTFATPGTVSSSPATLNFDVVVYGATPAGISAAITAARNGTHRVALVEPLYRISGMGAMGGLGLNDQIDKDFRALSGLALDFADRAGRHYTTASSGPAPLVVTPDMFVAQATWEEMVADAGSVSVFTSCPLFAAAVAGGLISNITADCSGGGAGAGAGAGAGTPSGLVTFSAPVFVDASYDGEAVVAAGLSFAHGREGEGVYNESIAGVQPLIDDGENFPKDAEVSAVFPNGTLLPYVGAGPLPPTGSGDGSLMAFQYRMCVTNDRGPGRRTEFPRPTDALPSPSGGRGYNPDDFALLQASLDAEVASGAYPDGPPIGWFAGPGPYSPEVASAGGRNKFILCCGGGPVNSDAPGLNAGWATASRAQRQGMADAYKYWVLGALYYLANDPRVPNGTRTSVREYALCADEWPENGNVPPQLYVRESVRLVGDVVLTQNTVATPRSKPDGVAVGAWFFDSHLVRRVASANATTGKTLAVNEGYWRAAVPSGAPCSKADCSGAGVWYDVPYSAMLPKRAECGNLLVPVALSVSSVVYSSARIETMYMGLGAAAGAAALQVVEAAAAGGLAAGLAVQDVDVGRLQADLTAEGWMIHGPPPPGPPPRRRR